MSKSKIEWTEFTWNPTTGCNKISPGCKNCYADIMSKRLKNMGQPKYKNGFNLTVHENELEIPIKRKKSSLIFVNSMSDLFHEDVSLEFIKKTFDVMNRTEHHTYQVLTKRSERLLDVNAELTWTKNIWMGVSVENQDYSYRIEHLKEVPAAVRFLSIEPMLGPITELNLEGIDWVIVGGESGHRARTVDPDWVRYIRDECIRQEVPFFFKQWGGFNKKKIGKLLDGRIWNEMPTPKVRHSSSVN